MPLFFPYNQWCLNSLSPAHHVRCKHHYQYDKNQYTSILTRIQCSTVRRMCRNYVALLFFPLTYLMFTLSTFQYGVLKNCIYVST